MGSQGVTLTEARLRFNLFEVGPTAALAVDEGAACLGESLGGATYHGYSIVPIPNGIPTDASSGP